MPKNSFRKEVPPKDEYESGRRLLQTRHLGRKDQRHSTAARVAVKNGSAVQVVLKCALFVCGFTSGILGGAYGLNGPPLVVYGNMRRWNAQHFRATLQAYFLPASFIGIIGYTMQGIIRWTVIKYFLLCLPVVIPAIFLGRYFNHKLKDASFFGYVYWGLIGIGSLLILFTVV